MYLYQGKIYNDDRLFILDLVRARKGDRYIWSIITRRNHEGHPAFRVDEFESRKAAVEFVKRTEPTTPRISLGGKSPEIPLSYDEYCKQLKQDGVPSAIEIYELNRRTPREIIVEEVESGGGKIQMNNPVAGNSFFYNYAHVALPILALGNPKKFYRDASSRRGNQYLIRIWEGLANKMHVDQPYDGLDVTTKSLRPDTEIIIIRMPKPVASPEVFYIGIAFRIKKQFVKTEVISSRYFTLELGLNIITQNDEYHFCEWVGAIEHKHLNYGRLPNSNVQIFMQAIETRLD